MLVREDGPALRAILNRPEKRNALSLEPMGELLGILRRAGGDSGVRAIVLEAEGRCTRRATTWPR